MKLCDTCIYRNNVEQLKPCIIYRDDCEFYEKEGGDMTREEAIKEIIDMANVLQLIPNTPKGRAVSMAIQALEQEPKTGHWILGVCDECGYDWGKDAPIASVPNFCPNCGCRMVEPKESEIHCNCTDAEIAKSFIEDVEAVKDLLPQENEG